MKNPPQEAFLVIQIKKCILFCYTSLDSRSGFLLSPQRIFKTVVYWIKEIYYVTRFPNFRIEDKRMCSMSPSYTTLPIQLPSSLKIYLQQVD